MRVYRLDKTGRLTVVADDVKIPDGLAFSPDEKTLYIIDDGSMPTSIRAYDVVGDGTRLANGRVFISNEKGRGDGLRLDVDGNLWCGWALDGLDGVMIFNKAGAPIGRIELPERCANVCLGGYRNSRLIYGRQPIALCSVGRYIRGALRVEARAWGSLYRNRFLRPTR